MNLQTASSSYRPTSIRAISPPSSDSQHKRRRLRLLITALAFASLKPLTVRHSPARLPELSRASPSSSSHLLHFPSEASYYSRNRPSAVSKRPIKLQKRIWGQDYPRTVLSILPSASDMAGTKGDGPPLYRTSSPAPLVEDFARQQVSKQQRSNFNSSSLTHSLSAMNVSSVNKTALHPGGVQYVYITTFT